MTNKIREMILNENNKENKNKIETMVIEQTLNKLFYLPPKPELETEMILAQANQKIIRKGLHLSAIIASEEEFCYREQVLSLFYQMAQGENIPINLKRIFTEGAFIGEKWQRLFLRGGLAEIKDLDQSRFVEKYDLSYTPDAIITIGKTKYIVEIKSMNTFQFQHATSHASGRKQLRMYMYLEGIKNGFVLCEDKNTQEFKIFPEKYGVTFDIGDIEEYIERLEKIQYYKTKFLEEKKMPKRKCSNSNTKRAKKCNMRDACFNIGMGRIKL